MGGSSDGGTARSPVAEPRGAQGPTGPIRWGEGMSQVLSSHSAPSRSGRPASDPAGVAFEGRYVRFMARLVKGVARRERLPRSPWKQTHPGGGPGG